MPHTEPRFGRRGAILTLFAFIYAGYGAALSAPRATPIGLELLVGRLHAVALVIPWVACALVAVTAALPWRVVPQWLGFTALFPLPGLWALSYGYSWLAWRFVHDGNPLGWAGALIWGLLVGVIAVIAGWPDVPKAST